MKTIIKNKRNYRTKIGRPASCESDPVANYQETGISRNHEQPTASTSALCNDEANNFSNSDDHGEDLVDEGLGSNNDEDEERAGPAAAGTKRKATESTGKGKQRRL